MSFGISAATAAVIGGGIAAAGAVGGAVISANASKSAAAQQAAAAGNAQQMQEAQWEQTQQNLAPYMGLGSSSITPLLQAMGYNVGKNDDGTYTFNGVNSNNPLQQTFVAPTAAEAASTPGYQFTLNQGLKATQNSAAARGLGSSGAALKGAATYASGLADSTYNDVYNRALSTFNTNYSSAANNVNRLQGIVGNGQNAAATNGSLGAATANSIGNTMTSGANAQAAGTVGSANALSSALGSIGNNAMLYGLTRNNAAPASTANYGAVNASNPSGYNVGSNSYGFTV